KRSGWPSCPRTVALMRTVRRIPTTASPFPLLMIRHLLTFHGARAPQAKCLLLVGLLATCGCGEQELERAAVHGRVTYKGQPIADGRIQFFPAKTEQAPVVVAEIKDGQYSLAAEQGPVLGNNRIEINAFEKTGRQVPDLSRENRNNPNRP